MLRRAVLQENRRFRRTLLPLAWAAVLAGVPSCADAPAATPVAPVVPLTVCEVLSDLPAQTSRNVAVLGRYSYREHGGSWVSEDTCAAAPSASAQPQAGSTELWMTVDRNAPRLPDDYELDAAVLHRKLTEMQRHTTLAKFRFGTPDFDRWAVIWGRVEPRKGDEARKAAANLLYRGEGAIYIIPN
jgi:hypothetical protein